MPYSKASDKRRNARERYRRKREEAKAAGPPPPKLPDLWDYQRELVSIHEHPKPPATTTIRKGTRDGITYFELRYALDCVRRGEAVGCWLPNQTLARRVSKAMWQPMTAESELAERASVTEYRFKSGGTMSFLWAGAPSQFRQSHFDLAVGDEWSELAPDLQFQGRPDQLLRQRVKASKNPRVILSSSPASGGDALLAAEASSGITLEWLLRCPNCKGSVSPRLDRLTKQGLTCERCGTITPHAGYLPGRFEAEEKPDTYSRDGQLYVDGAPRAWPASTTLIIRGLCSYAVPWHRHLDDKEACGDDPAALRALYSTIDAELDIAGAGRVKDLLKMRKKLERREGARLVAGCDVQHDRIECSFVQLGADDLLEVLAHVVCPGETTHVAEGAWAGLTDVLNAWQPRLCLIDSGTRTARVYEYCRRRRGCVAIKGRAELSGGRVWQYSKPRPDEGRRVALYLLNVDVLRRQWLARLESESRARFFAFDLDLDESYFKSLTSEREVVTRSKRSGAYKRSWITEGDNEASDTMTYAVAAAAILRNRRPAKRHRIRFAQ